MYSAHKAMIYLRKLQLCECVDCGVIGKDNMALKTN